MTDGTFDDAFDPQSAIYAEDPWRTRRGGGDIIVDFQADDRFMEVAVSNVSMPAGGRSLTFDRLGGTVVAPGLGAGPASVTLSDGQADWTISVAPVTGAVSVARAE